MVGNCYSSFRVLCAILIFFPGDFVVLTDSDNEPQKRAPELKTNGQAEETEEYPFDDAYYSYEIQSNELLKDTKLNPPIPYTTPNNYTLVLEPIVHFCKEVDTNILTKFSVIKLEQQVKINIDEDLTDSFNTDATIVFKLKVTQENDLNAVEGSTIIHIRIVQFLPIPDTILEFDEPSYSIKLSYGINGKVFKFKTFKRTLNEKEKNEISKCNNYPKNDEYSFNGNYSLEYVPDALLSKLSVNNDGDLYVVGYIDEGFYNFDVVAVDFALNSSTVLKNIAKVNLFVDNLAVCNSDKSYFIKAFSKHEITEENKLQTVVPATGSNTNCTFAISHQHPIGVGADFFRIDPVTGAVNVISPIDRESYSFEDVEEPAVYLRIKIYCPPPETPIITQPLNLHDLDDMTYDPTSTLIKLLIVDINDNPPTFADKHITIGYPVVGMSEIIASSHLIQVKATDKDTGKHGKIQYSLRGENAEDFVINPETGNIYCACPVDDSNIVKSFDVVAKDNDGKLEGYESTLNITVKFLTYSDIIRVNVEYSTAEDQMAIESQLSDITGFKVMSLTNDVINTFVDDEWKMVRSMIVYGMNPDNSLVSGSDLENKLEENPKILNITKYSMTPNNEKRTSVMTVLYAALFCLMLTIIAIGLLYFGYVKNGRYLSCILSTSTTPLKDDMENTSQSNWITTFNRPNPPPTRVRIPGKIDSPVSQGKFIDQNCTIIVENSLYEALPPKRNANTNSLVKLDSKLSFEDDLIKLEKFDRTFSPTDDKSFNY